MTSREESDGGSLSTWSSYTRGGLPSNEPRIGQDDSKMSNLEQRKAHTNRLDAHENNDMCFMVYRRFGWLHLQVLVCFRDELMQWEQSLRDPNKNDGRGPFQRQSFPTKDDFFTRPRRYLSQLITQLLARYGKVASEISR